VFNIKDGIWNVGLGWDGTLIFGLGFGMGEMGYAKWAGMWARLNGLGCGRNGLGFGLNGRNGLGFGLNGLNGHRSAEFEYSRKYLNAAFCDENFFTVPFSFYFSSSSFFYYYYFYSFYYYFYSFVLKK
jgi:hypothetical protein